MVKLQIVRPDHLGIDLVKLAVCAIIFTHGVHRYLFGEIAGLALFLSQSGFPAPLVEAHLINLAETGGVLLIACGLFIRTMCAVLVLIFLTSIVLIHWQAGFFIVGPGEGGWEFSALLIACLSAVAVDYGSSRLQPNKSFKPNPLSGPA